MSVGEEMARRIVQETLNSDKVNVLVYEGGWHRGQEAGYLDIHAWRGATTPPGTVYARTRLAGNVLNPGGVPCKSAKAVHAMMMRDDDALVIEPGWRAVAVVTGEVPIQPFVVIEKGSDWYEAFSDTYGERLHKFLLFHSVRDPYDSDTIEYWKDNAGEVAEMVWDILN